MTPPISNLVFSTRSASPVTGSDFVREVVAESPGVAPEVRAEFARRADVAGSVLQRHLEHPVYMFCRAGDAWLLCRAVSLGLYRKGSNQLLVHGLVLGEAHLDALECNPLLLDDEEIRGASGLAFLDAHPGSGRLLPELPFGERVAARAREVNRRHLEQARGLELDAQLAAAYETLAKGRRAGLVTRTPAPPAVEAVLLHFHPDDRLELSFHTFYSHSRPLDYRLLLLVPEDAPAARGHFNDLELIDLGGAAPTLDAGDLGALAVSLRRSAADGFLATVETYRVTYRSERFMPPLERADAALCLREGLGERPGPAGELRLRQLAARGQRGLRYRLGEMARTWRDEPGEFPALVAAMARAEDRVTGREVAAILEAPPPAVEERWCLLALLAHDEALQPGEDWGKERARAWRTLLSGRLDAFLDASSTAQATVAEPLLLDYALTDLTAAGIEPQPPAHDWAALLAWIGRRGTIPKTTLSRVEAALARLSGEPALESWTRLQPLLFAAGQPVDALRLFFSRTLPLLPAAEAPERSGSALRWWLDHGDDHDVEVAPNLGNWGVAGPALAHLGDWFAERPPGEEEPAFRRLSDVLAVLDELPAAAGPACGDLLAKVARTRLADRIPAVLEACVRALPQSVRRAEGFVGAALGRAAESLLPEVLASAGGSHRPSGLDAVAALLEARNVRPATGDADLALLRLAVLGRVVAGHGRGLPPGPPGFAGRWLAFLGGARVLEALQPRGADGDPACASFPALQDCLDLLQDEITSAPEQSAETDARLVLFTRLAWWRWCRKQGRPELAALSAKLYQVRLWDRKRASAEWLWQRMEEVVPDGPLRRRAAAVLPPRPETRRGGWLFGGRG